MRNARDAASLEHRRLLSAPRAHHQFAGGPAAVAKIVDGLLDRIERDGELRRLFGRDLTHERETQKRFFTEWLGGESAYSEHAHVPLELGADATAVDDNGCTPLDWVERAARSVDKAAVRRLLRSGRAS